MIRLKKIMVEVTTDEDIQNINEDDIVLIQFLKKLDIDFPSRKKRRTDLLKFCDRVVAEKGKEKPIRGEENGEEQKKLTESIGKYKPELEVLLQRLWAAGIGTKESTTRDSDNCPLVMMELKLEDMTNRMLIQEVYNQNPSLECTCDYSIEDENFSVTLKGDNLFEAFETTSRQGEVDPQDEVGKNNMYKDCLIKMLTEYEEDYRMYAEKENESEEYLQMLKEWIEKAKKALETVNKDVNYIRNPVNTNSQEHQGGQVNPTAPTAPTSPAAPSEGGR